MKITSLQNSLIKKAIKLRERKERDQTHLMLIEGVREVLRALESGIKFKDIFLCEDFLNDEETLAIQKNVTLKGVALTEVSRAVFKKLSFGDREEGFLGVAIQPVKKISDLSFKQKPFFVILEAVEKPGNLGAILRTCDAVGVDGLIVCDGQTDIYNPNVIRASLGTIFSVPVVQAGPLETLQFLKNQKIQICCTTPHTQNLYSKVNFNVPIAIVMGSEETGLTDFWLKKADLKVKIPMMGQVDSLNVSVTTAIMLYEALRQRQN